MPLKPFAAMLGALALFGVSAWPSRAAEFADAAGRHLMIPDHISRVMAAEHTADVLIVVLAPEKLIGWSTPHARAYLPPRVARLPVTGILSGLGANTGPDTIVRLRPDVVIDGGPISAQRVAFADQMQTQTGVPYILVDDSIERIPAMLRAIGAVLGVGARAETLAVYAQNAIASVHGRLLIQPANQRPRVYFGEDPDGMLAPLPGSPDGEVVDQEGAINVALGVGHGTDARITPAQLLAWDPEIIVAADPAFYDRLMRDRFWRALSAVRNKKVCLMPRDPFGWIDEPPGINRIVGLQWLSGVFYPGPTQEDVRTSIHEFYDTFYAAKLTDPQVEALVSRSCLPPATATQTANLPLLGAPPTPGLGSPGMLPGVAPGTPETAPATPGATPGIAPGVPPPGRRGLAPPPQ